MSHTVFANGVTLTDAAWFQDVDTVTYTLFGNGTNYTGNFTLASGVISTGSATSLTLGTSGGTGLTIANVASAVNNARFQGAAAAGAPVLTWQGTDTDVNGVFLTKGAGEHRFATNSVATTIQVRITNTAAAVNYIRLTGGGTGVGPSLSWVGSDTNVSGTYLTQGTGSHEFCTGSASNIIQVKVVDTPNATRWITLTGNNGGNPTIGTSAGRLNVSSALTLASLGAFAGGDKYLIVDGSGNVHVSALGPAS